MRKPPRLWDRFFARLGFSRRKCPRPKSRLPRQPRFEYLEARQMLTTTPALIASADPVGVGASVTITAQLPTTASSGSVAFTNGGTTTGESLAAASNGGALTLDGSTGYAALPDSLKFTPDNYTISEWFYPTRENAFQFIFMRGFSYGDQQGDIGLKINGTSNQLDFQVRTADNTWLFGWDAPESALSASFNFNAWNHVVVTRDSSTGTYDMWMNGVHTGTAYSTADTFDWGDSNPIYVGAFGYNNGPVDFFQGSVSEFDVFNRALSSDEVATLYNSGNGYYGGAGWAPTNSGLVAGYHFDEASGTVVHDYSGNGRNGALIGGTTWTTDSINVPEIATFPTSFATTGYQTVTATYNDGSGDATASLTETVLATTTTTITAPSSSDQGVAVTLTANLSSGSGTPGGVVDFYDDGSIFVGASPLDSSGNASMTTAALPTGSNSITAVYEGNATYFASTSDASTDTVLPSVKPVLTSTANPAVAGQPLTLTAAMPSQATGNIEFFDNGTSITPTPPSLSTPTGSALLLGGTGGGVSTTLALDPSTVPEMTITSWVKINGWDGPALTTAGYVGSFDGYYGGFQRGFRYTNGGDWNVAFGPGTGGMWDTGVPAQVGGWHQVSVVYASDNIYFYYDGKCYAYGSAGAWPYSGSSNFTIGYDAYMGGGQYTDGEIDEVGVWQSALSTSQMTTLYNGGSAFTSSTLSDYPDSSDMVAGWHFDDASGGTAADFVSGTYSGTLTGDASWTGDTAVDATVTYSTSFSTAGSHLITAVYEPATGSPYGSSASTPLPLLVLPTTLPSGVTNAPPVQATPSPTADGSLVLPISTTAATLNYVSAANGQPIVSADISIDSSDLGDANGITATLLLGDTVLGSTYYSTNDLLGAAADGTYRISVASNSVLDSGSYSFTLRITPTVDGSPGTSVDHTVTQDVLNWSGNQFGAGWQLAGLDQLIFNEDESITLVQSDGTMGDFTPADGGYTSPAGPMAFLNLVYDSDTYSYELTGTDGTLEAFDLTTGRLRSVTDHDGNVTLFNWSGTQLQSILDPAGHLTTFSHDDSGMVSSINDFAGRTTALAYSGTQLASITLPDPGDSETVPVYSFGYDATSGLMTSYLDANGKPTLFAYRGDGALATATTSDGATTSYEAAMSPVLVGSSDSGLPGSSADNPALLVPAADAVGVTVDASGAPTVYTYDQFGNPTSIENALGQTTIYVRNGNGQATDMYQPDPSTGETSTSTTHTSFTYDSSTGVLTEQQNPDGSQQHWLIETLTTYGGPDVVPYQTYYGTSDDKTHVVDYSYADILNDINAGDLTSVTQQAAATADSTNDLTTNYTYTAARTITATWALNAPAGIAIDSAGNIYVADSGDNTIRRIDHATGADTIVAGSSDGTAGYSGDGGSALDATLNAPLGVAVDSAGDIFIADTGNNVIRKVDATTGDISTVAGYYDATTETGDAGYMGDGGYATSAQLNMPFAVAFDSAGNLFIADTGNNVIREVSGGDINTVVGTGTAAYSGDGGAAIDADLNFPEGIAFDASGNLYIADSNNNVVRKVDTSGTISTISTIAGTGFGEWGGDGGPATSAWLSNPWDMAVDAAGNVFISDSQNFVVRELHADTGNITTIAGLGFIPDAPLALKGYVGFPAGIAVDASGNLFVAGNLSSVLNEISGSDSPAGLVTSMTDPMGNVTSYKYNSEGLLTEVDEPTSPSTVSSTSVLYVAAASVYYTYDTNDNLATSTDERGNTTYYTFDALDRKISETAPEDSDGNSPVTTWTYDTMGDVTSESDLQAIVSGTEVWATTNYTYNAVEEVVSTAAPGPNDAGVPAVTSYTYTPTGLVSTMTDASGGVTTYGYDPLGQETSVSLPDPATGLPGGPTTYTTYDPLGRTASETDAMGNVTSYSYAFGASYDPGMTVTTTLPDTATGADDSDSTVAVDAYDPWGNLLSETDPMGNTTTYAYNAFNQPEQQSVDSGPELGPTYDKDGNVINDTDLQNGAVSKYVYNVQNELVESYGPYPDLASGEATAQRGTDSTMSSGDWSPLSSGSSFSDGTGGAYSTTNSAATATYGFSDLTVGQQYEILVTWTANGSNTADASYTVTSGSDTYSATINQQNAPWNDLTDGDGRVWQSIVTFTASATTATVTLAGPTDSGRAVADGVQIEQARALTTYAYDAAGNMTSEIDPLGNVTTWGYDNLNRETSVSLPDPSTGAAGGPTTTYSYDLVNNLLSTVAPSPTGSGYATTTNTYDLANNLLTTTDANNGVTSYTYDTLGNVTSLTDPDGNTTSWTYDHLSQVTTQSEVVALGYFPDGTVDTTTATSHYFYDPDGNLTTSIDADYRSISYAYNHLNEETGETWYDASGTETGYAYYGYDANGNLTSAENATSTIHYARDAVGREVGSYEEFAGWAGGGALTATSYDFNGRETAFAAGVLTVASYIPTLTFDAANAFHYNRLGQLTQVGQADTGTITASDERLSQSITAAIAHMPYGDDSIVAGAPPTDPSYSTLYETGNSVDTKTVDFKYDMDSRLSGESFYGSTDGDPVHVASAAYAYNGDSNLTDLNYTTGMGSALAGYHWDYNSAGLVTDFYSRNDSTDTTPDATYTAGSTDWGHVTYAYDPTAQLLGATYDSHFANAPTTDNAQTFDANGNRTSGSTAAATNRVLFDGTYYYTYDAEGNRTSKYQLNDDGDHINVTTYAWDNRNQLVKVITPTDTIDYGYNAVGTLVKRTDEGASSTEYYVYDGQNLALVLDGSGNVIERELYGAAVDQVLASQNVSTGTTSWLLTDNLGSVRDVATYNATTGTTIADHITYDAFGQITSQSDPSSQPRATYDGAWQDPVTNLDKMGARWYEAVDAVFASQDPLGFGSGQTNTEVYVGNSPTNFTDPSGLLSIYRGNGRAATASTIRAAAQDRADYARFFREGPLGFIINGPVGAYDQAQAVNQDLKAGNYGAAAKRQLAFNIGAASQVAPMVGAIPPVSPQTMEAIGNAIDPAATKRGNDVGQFAIGTASLFLGAPEEAEVGTMLEEACFVAGTLVAGGRSCTPIEAIQVNDQVLAFDLTASSWRLCRVKKTFRHDYQGELILVRVSGETIESTPNHPYWIVRGENLDARPRSQHTESRPDGATACGRWVDAGNLREGDELLSRDGRILPIDSISTRQFSGFVYNIKVAELECYAVGGNSILVHNKGLSATPVRARPPVKEGIYEFPDMKAGGTPYVGQSGNVPSRLAQHEAAGRLSPGTETTTPVPGGKTAREIAEHNRIQMLTGGQKAKNSPAVSNQRDPIGPDRRPGLGLPEPRD